MIHFGYNFCWLHDFGLWKKGMLDSRLLATRVGMVATVMKAPGLYDNM